MGAGVGLEKSLYPVITDSARNIIDILKQVNDEEVAIKCVIFVSHFDAKSNIDLLRSNSTAFCETKKIAVFPARRSN